MPTDATAVFPPDAVPVSHDGQALAAADYTRAGTSYADASGREVNTANPGGHISAPLASLDERHRGTPRTSCRPVSGGRSTSADDEAALQKLAAALKQSPAVDPTLPWQALWLLSRAAARQGARREEAGFLEELVCIS